MLVANFGVLAGIFFLAIEIQQNTKLLEVEAANSYFQNTVFGDELIMGDGKFAEIYLAAQLDGELTPQDELRIRRYYRRHYRGYQWEYRQHVDGLLSLENNFQVWARIIRGNRYSRDEWQFSVENEVVKQDFVELMNRVFDEIDR